VSCENGPEHVFAGAACHPAKPFWGHVGVKWLQGQSLFQPLVASVEGGRSRDTSVVSFAT